MTHLKIAQYDLQLIVYNYINPLNAELNPICHLLALRGGATIVVVSRLRVNLKLIGMIINTRGWYFKIIVLLTQYCAGGKLEKNEMGGACGAYGEGREVHRVLVGKPEGKIPLGRPRRRWRIILRWIFGKWEGVVGTGWSWLRIGTGGEHL